MTSKNYSVLFTLFISAFVYVGTVQAASITGTAIYKGKKPKLRQIRMEADPICLKQHGDIVFPQTIVLGENNEMANVFVRVISGLPGKKWPAPTEPVILNQQGCMYDPSVFGVMVGQPLKILNPDGTLHNVHCFSKENPEFNLAMPKFRKEVTKIFKKPEFMFQMKCDVHPWMVTNVTVMEHPFYATTGTDGKFTISDLPPGDYLIEAWQQRLAPQKLNVSLAEGETKDIEIFFQRPDGK